MSDQAGAIAVQRHCSACRAPLDPSRHFCDRCGIVSQQPGGRHAVSTGGIVTHLPVPGFVQVAPAPRAEKLEALYRELSKETVLLWRERIFLMFHWALFLGLNLTGLTLAIQGYLYYIGDPLTKLVMAGTPIMYINSCSLLCMLGITGARRQIARHKERLTYINFQLEYSHLL